MPIAADRILRARAGDQHALEDLIREYQQPIGRFVSARLSSCIRDRAAVEDVCQGIFVKMVLSISRLRGPEAFEPWLFRIAENACRDWRRRERWRRRLFVPLGARHDAAGPGEAEAVSAPAQAELESAQLQRLRVGLAQIGAGHRQLLALSLERPRSYEELAALSHLSVPAVKARLFRARARLRRLIGREESGT